MAELSKVVHVGFLADVEHVKGYMFRKGEALKMTVETYDKIKADIPEAVVDLTPRTLAILLGASKPDTQSVMRFVPCPVCNILKAGPNGMMLFQGPRQIHECLVCGTEGKIVVPSKDEGLCFLIAGFSEEAVNLKPGLGKEKSVNRGYEQSVRPSRAV